ncbi:hypothetical protein BDZ91DRAFT_711865, partial [Kalaharituber pfeilii]
MTTARRTNLYHSKRRTCDYLVTGKEAGVMGNARCKRLRREKKRTKKLRLRSGQSSLPLLFSTSSKFASLPIGDSPLTISHHISQRHSPPSSLPSVASSRQAIRTRARRWYLCYLERAPLPKSYCSPSLTSHQLQRTPQLPLNQLKNISLTLPPNDMPNDLDIGRRSDGKPIYRHQHLIDTINKVEAEQKDRDRLHGLVTCAEEFKQREGRGSRCVDIKSLGWSWFLFPLLTFILLYLNCQKFCTQLYTLKLAILMLSLKYFSATHITHVLILPPHNYHSFKLLELHVLKQLYDIVPSIHFRAISWSKRGYLNCDYLYIFYCAFMFKPYFQPFIKLETSFILLPRFL